MVHLAVLTHPSVLSPATYHALVVTFAIGFPPWMALAVGLSVMLVQVVPALTAHFLAFLLSWLAAQTLRAVLWVSGDILLELFPLFDMPFSSPFVESFCRLLSSALLILFTVLCLWSLAPFFLELTLLLVFTNLLALMLVATFF